MQTVRTIQIRGRTWRTTVTSGDQPVAVVEIFRDANDAPAGHRICAIEFDQPADLYSVAGTLYASGHGETGRFIKGAANSLSDAIDAGRAA